MNDINDLNDMNDINNINVNNVINDESELYIYLGIIDYTLYLQHTVSNYNYNIKISYDIGNFIITNFNKNISNIIIYEINPILNKLYIIYIEFVNNNYNFLENNFTIKNLSEYYIELLKLENNIIHCIFYNYKLKYYTIHSKSITYNIFKNSIPNYIPSFSEIYKNIIYLK
jgi:hypothetical protein